MERRTFLKSASLATVAVMATPSLRAEKDKNLEMQNAFSYDHKPKKLLFKPTSINGLSEKMILSHWENNYSGSVKSLNEIKE